MKQIPTLLGAALAAVAASACCILPAILGAASVGTLGFSAALAPYRPYLMGLTVLLLGTAFYFTYRPSKASCDVGGHCASGQARGVQRLSKAILWGVSLFTIVALAYPTIAEFRAHEVVETQAKAATSPITNSRATAKTAVFTISNMSCPSCTPHITDALRKTPGVRDAKVDFEAKQATVRYNGAQVNAAKLRAAIEQAGFAAREVSASVSP